MPAEDTIKINILTDVKDAVMGFGKAALALAGVSMSIKMVVQFVAQSVQEFFKAEEAAAKMNAALKATGGYSRATSDELDKLAFSLMQTTKFEDEASKEALALMMSLGGMTAKMAADVLPTLQDFAAGMGMDISTAASLFSKAIEGNVGALSRYGIRVQEGLKGSELLNAIVGQMTEKFGGMAKAVGDTASGAMTRLNNNFGEMREELGRSIATSMKGFVDWLATVAGKIAGVMRATNDLRDALNAEARGIADASDKLKIAQAEYNEVREAITTLNKAYKSRYDLEAIAYDMATRGTKTMEEYNKSLLNSVTAIRMRISGLEQLVENEKKAADAAAEQQRKLNEYTDKLAAAYAKTPEAQRAAIEEDIAYWEKAVANAKTGKDKIIAILALLREQLAEKTKIKFPEVGISQAYDQENQEAMAEGVADAIARQAYALDEVKEAAVGVSQAWDQENQDAMAESLADNLERQAYALKDIRDIAVGVNQSWDQENQEAMAENVADAIARQKIEAIGLAKELTEQEKLYEKMAKSFTELAKAAAEEGLYDLFYQMGQAAMGVDAAAESFRAYIQGLTAQLAKLFIAAGLQSIIQGHFWIGIGLLAAGGVAAIAAGAMNAEATAPSPAVEQTGLVHLQGGGIVRRPTMALIGEGGPEAVVPLGRGAGVVVNVYGSVWSGDDLARVVARKLLR